MQRRDYITIISDRKKEILSTDSILYLLVDGKNVEIHTSEGTLYRTRMSLGELEKNVGDGFIKVHRGCIVAAMSIHDVTDKINLNNGECLDYTKRKKREIVEKLHEVQKRIVHGFRNNGIPVTEEEYRQHYQGFEQMPFAFTDIEMVFDEENHAVDWIFRYGNQALARLEKVPLEQLIGNTFGSIFPNMDARWLKLYERATLYREILESIDYSPEIDTYLKVICFPTFQGHCGCILIDDRDIHFTKNSSDAATAFARYFGTQ